jgi:uncharacterized membrane protein YoaK (UPF0700 family)
MPGKTLVRTSNVTSNEPAPSRVLGPCIVTASMMTIVGGFVDAYTFLSHGVFALAQTGNVIFMAIGLATHHPVLIYLWPVLAYLAGVVTAQAVKRLHTPRHAVWALSATLIVQVIVLALIAVLPSTAPEDWVVLPLSAIAGLQLALFRNVSGVAFVSIATTGNLMRFAEAFTAFALRHTRENLRPAVYTAAIVLSFVLGAMAGAFATHYFGHTAIAIAAGLQVGVLVLFIRDTRAAEKRPRVEQANTVAAPVAA